jgi:hypothetical protein
MSYYTGECILFSGKEKVDGDYSTDYRDYYIMETEAETIKKLVSALKKKKIKCSNVVILSEDEEEGTRVCRGQCEYEPTRMEAEYLAEHNFLDVYIPKLTTFGFDVSNSHRRLEFTLYKGPEGL